MAVAAAPYCHAKLTAVEYKEPAFEIEELTDEELEFVMKHPRSACKEPGLKGWPRITRKYDDGPRGGACD